MAQTIRTGHQRSEARPTSYFGGTGFFGGWVTYALHLVIIVIAAGSVLSVDVSERRFVLIPVAIGGLTLGYALPRFRDLDGISHAFSLVVGLAGSLALTAISIDGWHVTRLARGRNIVDLARGLFESQMEFGGSKLTNGELTVIIGITLWLIAYSSAWMLCRRHWLMPAVFLPGVLIFVNLRFEEQDSTLTLAVFALCALIMTARHQALTRQIEWSRRTIPMPAGLPGRFTAAGSIVAVVTLLLGSFLPSQAPSGVVDSVADQVVKRWDQVAGKLDSFGNPAKEQTGESAIYTSFSDSFVIGGEFKPSQQEVASLEAQRPLYLALRRYDKYTGTGWTSDVDRTFRMDGDGDDVTATSVTFSENQYVAVSDDVSAERDLRAGVITVLQDKDGLLFTTDSFIGATLPTVAVLGWNQLPKQEIDVNSVSIASLPVDLQGLISMLRDAEFRPDPDTGKPEVRDSQESFAIEQERSRLLSYPVETVLSYDEAGNVIVTVSGRLPNYDDIEAVFSNKPVRVQERYRVTGTQSIANADQLASAGTDYPEWVTDRYLQLPTSVTTETVQLAIQVIADAGAETTFDKAWAIQEYLHNTYQYALNSEQTPAGRDAVDFFLFGKRVGRCEDYATSMVVMLRSQGIPARLVAGYRSGSEVDSFGDYLYREEQAHTWVEVFFPAYGWIPFEPTQGQAPFNYNDEPDLLPEEGTAVAEPVQPTPTAFVEPAAETTPAATPIAPVPDSDSPSFRNPIASGAGLMTAAILGSIAIFMLIASGIWLLSLRGLRPGASLFTRVMRIGRFWGVRTHETMTPGEYASEFGRAVPKASGAARYVADLYSAETYGGVDISLDARQSGNEAWKAVRRNLVAWRPWKRRK